MLRYCSRLILVAVAAQAAPDSEPPTTWIDPDTGHRIVRLTREPGSASLYFNQNGYTADGRKMVYTTPDGISVLDLKPTRPSPSCRARSGSSSPAERRRAFTTPRKAPSTHPTSIPAP